MLLQRFGGKLQHLRKIVEVFEKESAQLLTNIHGAIADGDPVKLQRAAHSLKGAVAIFGVPVARELAQKLELLGQAGDLAGAEEAYTVLEREINRLKPALTRMVGQ